MQVCPNCSAESPERFRLCGFCGTELQPDLQQEIRRTVTILSSDLKGSTTLGESLDSEALFEVLSRYFDAMRLQIGKHGGTIEKLIGDAVVAVFGLPVARPDDALRAVRAASDCQAALERLNEDLDREYGVRLTNRTGLATGEVTVGVPSAGQHVLTGRAVQLATRLEQTCEAMRVHISQATCSAVEGHVQVEPSPPVTVPWDDEPVDAYHLVRVFESVDLRRADADRPADVIVCRNCGEENPAAFTFCGTCGAALAATADVQESRKTVTIVFTDLKATDLDGMPLPPPRLRPTMTRAFEIARGVVERHGGTAEKFIGDAVVAVFGLPVLHEDDALRAVRAAAAILRAMTALDVELQAEGVRLASRLGVNTGLVVAGDATQGLHLVTGDAVNTAARLEQAAPENAILLGQSTYGLVRDAVDVEAVEPLVLKGKAEPVPAHRLVNVHAIESRARRLDTRMIGRERELGLLRRPFHESVVQNGLRMVTVLGDAGIGKSRLVREFERYVDGTATILSGRCLAYGEGITFWPIIEAVRGAAGIQDDDSPLGAHRKVLALVGDREVADRLASILGLTDATFPLIELFWGVRRTLEILSLRRPVVVVIDGVHWAEPAFLELIEYLVASTSEAPVELVCVARHELLEQHPEWGGGARSSVVVLQPLARDDAGLVVDDLLHGPLDPQIRSRIVEAADGNPLFMEQMISMLVDGGTLRFDEGRWIHADEGGEIRIPPSIQALLAARVDQLPREERSVVEPAAVVGQGFSQAAVEALIVDAIRPDVDAGLTSLVARQFIRFDAAASSTEAWYRFLNQLIRDAAYQGLLKRSRVAFHERFVAWSDELNRERGREREFEEILGFHLEQAYKYRTEFGPADAKAVAVGRDAAHRLSSAARRSFARGDMASAASLLRRSVDVLSTRDPDRLALLPELGEALMELGEFGTSEEVLAEAIRLASDVGDERLAAHARLVDLLVKFYSSGDVDGWSGRAEAEASAAVATFERLEDHAGLTRAWRILFGVHATACRYGQAADAAAKVVEHAMLAEDARQEARGGTGYAQAALLGPVPVPDAIARCTEILGRVQGDRRTEAMVLLAIAELEGMAGSFESAREHYVRARTMLTDLGKSVYAASTSMNSWRVEALAGDIVAAELELRRDYDALDHMGERFILSTLAGLLGHVVVSQGRIEEAAAFAARARELADADDISSQALWRSLEARVLAGSGRADEGLVLAREAIEILDAADSPVLRADVFVDLADVLEAAGRDGEAADALAEALRLYEEKANRVAADQVRARLAAAGAVSEAVTEPAPARTPAVAVPGVA